MRREAYSTSLNKNPNKKTSMKTNKFASPKTQSRERAPEAVHAPPTLSLQAKGFGHRFSDFPIEAPVQRKDNQTGLPDNLKSGVESLSGIDMSDVQVHFNSSKPASIQAHAYTQGTQIHVAPGQERHLPHEAWHVVQQKQGRVKPTLQLKNISINDSQTLEQEADLMGARALRTK